MRKLMTFAIAAALTVGMLPATAFAQDGRWLTVSSEPMQLSTQDIVSEGTCGTCTWGVDEDGHLMIWPTVGSAGELEEWAYPGAPWRACGDEVKSVSFFGTVKAPTCESMFSNMVSLTSVDLSGLDASQAADASFMFYGCDSLTSVKFSNADMASVTNAEGMFCGCESLTSLDLSNANMASVMNTEDMFNGCLALAMLKLPNTGMSKVENASNMFEGCVALHTAMLPKGLKVEELPGTWKGPQGIVLEGSEFGQYYNPEVMNGTWVRQFDLEKCDVGFESIGDSTYTGARIEPAVLASESNNMGITDLIEGVDYKVSYRNNVNVGTAQAIVAGAGNSLGSQTLEFDISPASIADADLVLSCETFTYNGKTQKPTVKTVDGMTLKEGRDYTVEYWDGDSIAAGDYGMTISGIGNYDGGTSAYYTIQKAKSKISIANQTKTYTGSSLTYTGKVTKVGSTGSVSYDYYLDAGCKTLATPGSPYDAGTYYVKATLESDDNCEEAVSNVAKFVVKKASQKIKAKNCSVVCKAQKTKTGKALAKSKTFYLGAKAKASAETTIRYAKANKAGGSKIAIGPKAGKVTLKKGLKAGTYKVKVKLTAAKSANYKAAKAKTITLTVKVK